MRKLVILALVVVALGVVVGTAAAESGGYVPPIRAAAWGFFVPALLREAGLSLRFAAVRGPAPRSA